MSSVPIRNAEEAERRLAEALKVFEAVTDFTVNQGFPRDHFFGTDVRRRLLSCSTKRSNNIHVLLKDREELNEHEKVALSPYCIQIEKVDDEDILKDINACFNELDKSSHQEGKGQLIDSILSQSNQKSMSKVLHVIGSLALIMIRDAEANLLADALKHQCPTTVDRSDAVTKMWNHLKTFNPAADRSNLDSRISAGKRWTTLLKGKEIGYVVAARCLPPSLKTHFLKLAPVLEKLKDMANRAEQATPIIRRILDLKLRSWDEHINLGSGIIKVQEQPKKRTICEVDDGETPKRQKCHKRGTLRSSAVSTADLERPRRPSGETKNRQPSAVASPILQIAKDSCNVLDQHQLSASKLQPISLEAAFIKSSSPRYTVQYDSPIFICVQLGDIRGARALIEQGVASIYDVDPYDLGLLYYAGYYCWRRCGAIKAIQMCGMLIQIGADMNMLDEIGNTPAHTMTDSALVERNADLKATVLINVGLLCGMSSEELVEAHRSSCKLTTLHEILLGINLENSSLREHLRYLQGLGLLAELIDQPDSHGRSALAWAVEYGMADAVVTLLSFGANVDQYRMSSRSQFPLLHLVIAGPSPPLISGFFQVIKILLTTGIDINARDNEGWSAWHVAASWRSYDILGEIMRTHGVCVELEAQTNDGASAYDLSQDKDFYMKLMPYWSE